MRPELITNPENRRGMEFARDVTTVTPRKRRRPKPTRDDLDLRMPAEFQAGLPGRKRFLARLEIANRWGRWHDALR